MISLIFISTLCIGTAGPVKVVEENGKKRFLINDKRICSSYKSQDSEENNKLLIPGIKPSLIRLTPGQELRLKAESGILTGVEAFKDTLSFSLEGEDLVITLLNNNLTSLPVAIKINNHTYQLTLVNSSFFELSVLHKLYEDSVYYP